MTTLLTRLSLVCTLACALVLSACGPSNTVRLRPLQPAASVLPTPSSSTISVVKFADKRVDPSSLGLRRDQSYFTTMDNVPDWLSRSIADDLAARGYQVSYATSAAEAIKAQPDYILTGSLESMAITELSTTSFQCDIRVKYMLSSKQKMLMTETLTANQSRTAFPSNSAIESIAHDTLKDIVVPMTDKLQKTIGR